MDKSKVYVTNFSGYTYEKADSYGELIFITQGFVNIENVNDLRAKLTSFIRNANERDYLLLSGNNLLCGLAIHIWLDIHNSCKVLHWNGLKKGYDLHSLTK
jgi:hypothetical protein